MDGRDPGRRPDLVPDAGDRRRRRRRGLQERTGPSRLAYNGVAWIADPTTFFVGLRRGVDTGELRSPGLRALLDAGVCVRSEPCDWTDAAPTETYVAARAAFAEYDTAAGAAIDVNYLLPDRVVKWFAIRRARPPSRRAAELTGAYRRRACSLGLVGL